MEQEEAITDISSLQHQATLVTDEDKPDLTSIRPLLTDVTSILARKLISLVKACGICLELFRDARTTPCCESFYCLECIVFWAFKSQTCPNCRDPIQLEQLKAMLSKRPRLLSGDPVEPAEDALGSMIEEAVATRDAAAHQIEEAQVQPDAEFYAAGDLNAIVQQAQLNYVHIHGLSPDSRSNLEVLTLWSSIGYCNTIMTFRKKEELVGQVGGGTRLTNAELEQRLKIHARAMAQCRDRFDLIRNKRNLGFIELDLEQKELKKESQGLELERRKLTVERERLASEIERVNGEIDANADSDKEDLNLRLWTLMREHADKEGQDLDAESRGLDLERRTMELQRRYHQFERLLKWKET